MVIIQLYKNDKKVKKFENKLSYISESSKYIIMKFLFYFNLTCFLLVVLSTVVNPLVGVVLLIPLGLIQVITALFFVTKRTVLNSRNQKLLAIYFTAIFVWFILMALISVLHIDIHVLEIILGLLPILIAVYFLYFLFQLQKKI